MTEDRGRREARSEGWGRITDGRWTGVATKSQWSFMRAAWSTKGRRSVGIMLVMVKGVVASILFYTFLYLFIPSRGVVGWLLVDR